jgi:putative ABC transport system substrate-binding protein
MTAPRPSRRRFCQGGLALLGLGLQTGCQGLAPEARPPAIPRVGILLFRSRGETAAFMEAFRQGLQENGLVEGQNVIVEDRYADGSEDRLAELAAELVRLKVDVIVTGSNLVVPLAVKPLTSTIPIVMAGGSFDPVADGLVASLSRPGGNITGVTTSPPEQWGKRLELLKEMVPGLTRVALLNEPIAGAEMSNVAVQAGARALALQLQMVEARGPDDFERAFSSMAEQHAEALVISGTATYHNRVRVAEHALRHRLPLISPWREVTEVGGLMSYAPSASEYYRAAATYADKILKGARPSELPVERPTRFDFVINLNTARTLGLTVPPSLLAQVTELIQ